MLVSVGAVVGEGAGVSVTGTVRVGCGVKLGVVVLKLGMLVTPGVLVGTFGTYNTCPTYMIVDEPIQLARWRSATVVRYKREMR